jgi:hypothetical protein
MTWAATSTDPHVAHAGNRRRLPVDERDIDRLQLGSTLRSLRFQCDYFHCIKSETLLGRQRERRLSVATAQPRSDGRRSMQRFSWPFSRKK